MEIIVNDQKKTVSEQTLLAHIVTEVTGDKQKGIAVAVNENVIPKNLWHQTELQPNDQILIIKATQGG